MNTKDQGHGFQLPPRREAELVTWSGNFKTKITATPTAFRLTAAQAASYGTKHDAFVAAYTVAQGPETRFDIAGCNRANPGSMRAAIELAIGLAVKKRVREEARRRARDTTCPSRPAASVDRMGQRCRSVGGLPRHARECR